MFTKNQQLLPININSNSRVEKSAQFFSNINIHYKILK